MKIERWHKILKHAAAPFYLHSIATQSESVFGKYSSVSSRSVFLRSFDMACISVRSGFSEAKEGILKIQKEVT